MFKNVVPDLHDLCKELGREEDYLIATSGDVRSSEYFRDVVYAQSYESTTDTLTAFDEKWRIDTPTAFLNTRFYPQRCDDRAFVSDEDCLRSLLGSILHSILYPKRGNRRKQYEYFKCWPVKGKNVVTLKEKHGITDRLHIAHYDVSSFTASFRNVWSYLLEVLAYASEEKCNLPSLVVSVNGQLISMTLEELLRLYLFLAYRVKVFDTVAQDDFTSLGGMLGVAGINTACCVLFASLLQMFSRRLLEDKVTFEPRAGGDDVFAKFLSKSEHANLIAYREVGKWIRMYVGELSEATVQTITFQEPACGFLLSTNNFCKKRVLIRWNATGSGAVLRYQSQYNLPVYSILLQPELRDSDTFEEQAAGFFSSLNTSLPWVADKGQLITLFTRVFHAIHGPFRAECAGKAKQQFPNIPFRGPYSEKALRIIEQTSSPVLRSGEAVIRSWDSMVTYLLIKRALVAIDGPVDAWDTHFVTLPEYASVTHVRSAPLIYETTPVSSLLVALVVREFLITASCVL